ncbi:hypothetical protein Chor_007387 [Crotalus horridus]
MSEKSADEAPVELGAKELKEKKEKHEEKSTRKDKKEIDKKEIDKKEIDKKEIVEDDENGAEEEEDDEDANPEDVDDEDEEDEDDENEREPDTHAVKRSAEKKQEELTRKERRQKMALQLDPLGSICILFSAVQLSAHLRSSVCAGSLCSAVAVDEEEEEFNVLSVKRKLKEALLQLPRSVSILQCSLQFHYPSPSIQIAPVFRNIASSDLFPEYLHNCCLRSSLVSSCKLLPASVQHFTPSPFLLAPSTVSMVLKGLNHIWHTGSPGPGKLAMMCSCAVPVPFLLQEKGKM